MSLSIKICMLALVCTVAGVVIKQIRPDFAPFVRMAGNVAIVTVAVTLFIPTVAYIRSLFAGSSLGEYGGIITKALGIAVLTQLCADICRDCGESSVASGVELIGKLEMLVLCFPMIEKLLDSVREVMSWA